MTAKEESNVITSPNFPNNYDPNMDCTWIIKTALHSSHPNYYNFITLVFEYVYVNYHNYSLHNEEECTSSLEF